MFIEPSLVSLLSIHFIKEDQAETDKQYKVYPWISRFGALQLLTAPSINPIWTKCADFVQSDYLVRIFFFFPHDINRIPTLYKVLGPHWLCDSRIGDCCTNNLWRRQLATQPFKDQI